MHDNREDRRLLCLCGQEELVQLKYEIPKVLCPKINGLMWVFLDGLRGLPDPAEKLSRHV